MARVEVDTEISEGEDRQPIELYLGDQESCVVCPSHDPMSPQRLVTRDHIFPVMACKEHSLIMGSFKDRRFNLATICRARHDRVDDEKMRRYRQSGLVGLIDFNGRRYPSAMEDLQDLQLGQWVKLYTELLDNIRGLNGNTPHEYKADYMRGADLAEEFLTEWEQGEFILPVADPFRKG